jgi:hypothetical protein
MSKAKGERGGVSRPTTSTPRALQLSARNRPSARVPRDIRPVLGKIAARYGYEPNGYPWAGTVVPRARVPDALKALYEYFGGHREVIKSSTSRLYLPAELIVAEDGAAFADAGSPDLTYLYRKDPESGAYSVYRTDDVEGGKRHLECDLETFLVHFLGWMLCCNGWEDACKFRLSHEFVRKLPRIREDTAKKYLGVKSTYPQEVIFNDKYVMCVFLEGNVGVVGYYGTTLSDVAERYSITELAD